MKKLLVLIINNYLIVILVQSPTWCDIWNHVETLLTSLNQTLPPIIKSGLTLLAYLTVQVNSIIKQYIVQPLVIYLVFTVVKIIYEVCFGTGYYNYNPFFIKQRGLLFQAYNTCEAVTYWIIRDFATQNPSPRYIIYSFCIMFAVKVLNLPLTLLTIAYFWWTYGWSKLRYLVGYGTQYSVIAQCFKSNRLTFQRWEVIYNGDKWSPYVKKYIFDIRDSATIEGLHDNV